MPAQLTDKSTIRQAELAEIGQRIRSLRLFHGMTQEQLAERLNVTKGAVSQWESGRVANLKLAHLFDLCDVFSVDVYSLALGPRKRRNQPRDGHVGRDAMG